MGLKKVNGVWIDEHTGKQVKGTINIAGSIYWVDGRTQEYLHPANYVYKPSQHLLEQIKSYEGWHEGWVDDGKGNPTTGWGYKITPSLKKAFPHGMTKPQADRYFIETAIPERVRDFRQSVPCIRFYNQNQLDALFDLFYNVGITGFTTKSPKLMEALKRRDIKQILANMDHDYNDAAVPGAKKRRDWERNLFMKPVSAPIKEPIRQHTLENHTDYMVGQILETEGGIPNSLVSRRVGEYDVVPGDNIEVKYDGLESQGRTHRIYMYSSDSDTYCLFRRLADGKYFFAKLAPCGDSSEFTLINWKCIPKIILRDLSSRSEWRKRHIWRILP